MFPSAEVRWFWHSACPQPVHDWFFKTGLSAGGGHPRTDRYLSQPNATEISIKERGGIAGLQVKGLVATRRHPVLTSVASHIELWCKWSCTIPGLKLIDAVSVTKTRWLRQFDTSKPAATEIPLDLHEKPKAGYSLPIEGCNVELTELRISNRSDLWWTLGFEAFGDFDTVPMSLTRVLLPEKATLASIVSSGTFLNYPSWLLQLAN